MAKKKPTQTSAAIDTELVKHVAYLVRLGIEEQEAVEFSRQFNSIIDYFNLLNEADTSQVPPATEITATRNVMRPDEVTASMSREEFLGNVPHSEGNFVEVPLVFDEE